MKLSIYFGLGAIALLSACGNGDVAAGAAEFGGGTGDSSSGGGGTTGSSGDGNDGDPTTDAENAAFLGSAIRISTGRDRFVDEQITGDIVGTTGTITSPDFTFVGRGNLQDGFVANGAEYENDSRFPAYNHLNVYTFNYAVGGTDFSGQAVLGTPTPLAEVPNAGSTGTASYTGQAVFTYQNRSNGGDFPTWQVQATSRVQVGFASQNVTAVIDIGPGATVTTSGGAGALPFDRIRYNAQIDGNRFKLQNEAAWDLGTAGPGTTAIATSAKETVIGPSVPPGGLGGTGAIEGVFYGTNDATNQPAEVGATFLARGNIGVLSGALAAN